MALFILGMYCTDWSFVRVWPSQKIVSKSANIELESFMITMSVVCIRTGNNNDLQRLDYKQILKTEICIN